MNKIGFRKIIAVLVGVLMMYLSFYEFFGPNKGIKFYSEKPHLLLVAIIIGFVSGILVWVYYVFSKPIRRRIRLFLAGTIAVIASIFTISFLRLAISFFRDMGSQGSLMLLGPAVAFGVITIIAWLNFIRIYRNKK